MHSNDSSGITLKMIKNEAINNWKLFVIFCAIGIVGGLAYYKISPPYHKITTTILIKDDSKSSEINNVFREMRMNNNNATLEDQIGVLKSYSLNLRTMQLFNWQTMWTKKDWLLHRDLYGHEPFELIQAPEAMQTRGVRIKITPVSETEYIASCDEITTIRDNRVAVSFENRLQFGDTLDNKFFKFAIQKKSDASMEIGEDYYLEFKNISHLATEYKENLKIKPVSEESESNLILVELTTSNLARDVDYMNQLGKVYIQFGIDEKNRIADNTIKFIDDQISGVNQTLQVAGDRFSNFRSRNRTVDLGQEASSVVEKQNQIEKDRADIELRLSYYNNLKYYLENRDLNNDLVAPSLVGVTDNTLTTRVAKLNELYTKREVLSYTAQERNPVIISLNNEINYIRKILLENVDNFIGQANMEMANLKQRQNALNNELYRLPKTEQDLIGIKRNFDLNNELYTFLLERRAEAEIAKASTDADAQILDPADTEVATLIGPILTIDLAAGLFIGLFLAYSIVVARWLMMGVIKDTADVTTRLDVDMVGSIVTSAYKTEKAVIDFPRSALTESLRGLRINLDHFLNKVNGKVIAVQALIPGAGKSFVSFNLALMFAQLKKKVLLIDGDMRKPKLHKVMGLQLDNGLSEYLKGEREIKKIVRSSPFPNLSFISAGELQPDSSELLSNGQIQLLINTLREEYDYIIIDNSPIGIIHDSSIIGAQADANLFLLRMNVSEFDEINEINKIGRQGIMRGVMVALNGKKHAKGYGYYSEGGK
jgi:tyrosine-protein kinase Etk/Wzc